MSYNVRFTDQINNPTPLTVEDNTVNDYSTSLVFPGRNTTGYGQIVAENFLHLLENFANTEPPENPVAGQLWYDTNVGINQLKVNIDGTPGGWQAAGGLKRGSSTPVSTASVPGDLWVNTTTQQLFLFSGSGWVLVGPEFSEGSTTGSKVEYIDDTTNVTQTVLSQFVAGERVAIFSKTEFIPKSLIPGFSIIRAGCNLNTNYNKYYGVAEKAEALLVGTSVVSASNFLRSDVTNNAYYPLNIKNSTGIAIGEDSQLNLFMEGGTGVLYNKQSDSILDLRVNDAGTARTVIRMTSDRRVGINNSSPQEALDVSGNLLLTGTIRTTDTTESSSINTGALQIPGGAGIAKNLNVGGALNLGGALTVASVILPDTNNGANLGSASQQFNRIWASRIDAGEFYGNLIGTLTGNLVGSASKLTSETTFRLIGDITSDTISFDGSTGGLDKPFTTQISETFVADKPEVTDIAEYDEFLVSHGVLGLRKISKENLWKAISKTPVGTMNIYGGQTAPAGWLLCDGSEVKTSDYPALFQVIGYSFGDQLTLQGVGTFKLPDLRGRFPLGLDNMNNGITVPSKIDPTNLIQPGGGPANRVTAVEADSLGLGSGAEQRTLAVSNIPEHEHDLKGNSGNQYFAYRNVAGAPTDENAVSGKGPSVAGEGQYLATSGGILTEGALGQPFNIMNPYLAINFIIYTGQDV